MQRLAFTILSCSVLVCASAQVPSPMADDLAHKSPQMRWPAGFVPDQADLFAHNEVAIATDCATVFGRLRHAGAWPAWYANAHDVKVAGSRAGLLGRGARFDWTTFGLAVHSTVREFDPPRRLGWFGNAPGMRAYHTWLLTPTSAGCHVMQEEVVLGEGARKWREASPEAMHAAHETWGRSLKAVSEGAR